MTNAKVCHRIIKLDRLSFACGLEHTRIKRYGSLFDKDFTRIWNISEVFFAFQFLEEQRLLNL